MSDKLPDTRNKNMFEMNPNKEIKMKKEITEMCKVFIEFAQTPYLIVQPLLLFVQRSLLIETLFKY